MSCPRREHALTAGLVASVIVAAMASAPPGEGPALRLIVVGSMLIGSGLAAWLGLRGTLSRRRLIGVAVLLRLLALPVAPSLSDDGFRYLWDGELVVAGISPYAHRPADPALDAFRAEPAPAALYAAMNSPNYFSVYPPVSQAVFASAAAMPTQASGWLLLKGLLVGAELFGVWCFARVVPAGRLALYAWSPVAVLEIAGQGHTEALLVAALGAIWLSVVRGKAAWLSAAVVVAGWAKLFPFALATLLMRRLRPAGWLGFGVAALAVGAPLLVGDGLGNLLTSVRLYGGTLDFYSAPYRLLKGALYPVMGEPSGRLAASMLSLAWLAAVVWAWRRDEGGVERARVVLLVVVVGYAVTGAMAHPWNLLGVLALVPLMRTRGPALWLVGVAPVTYLRYVGLPAAYEAALVVGWGGAVLLWAATRYRARASTSSGTTVSASSQR